MDENVIFKIISTTTTKKKNILFGIKYFVYIRYIFFHYLSIVSRGQMDRVSFCESLQRMIFTGSGNGTRKQEQTKVLIVGL